MQNIGLSSTPVPAKVGQAPPGQGQAQGMRQAEGPGVLEPALNSGNTEVQGTGDPVPPPPQAHCAAGREENSAVQGPMKCPCTCARGALHTGVLTGVLTGTRTQQQQRPRTEAGLSTPMVTPMFTPGRPAPLAQTRLRAPQHRPGPRPGRLQGGPGPSLTTGLCSHLVAV